MDELLRVEGAKKYFSHRGFVVRAVDGVSFTIGEGETFGLVGESGCGKSTTGRLVLRLIELSDGKIYFDGQDIENIPEKVLRRQAQIIFQDPYSSLNPRMTAGSIIGEPLILHRIVGKGELREKVEHLLNLVGLRGEDANKFPHEFSGGQRQRIAIARAIAVEPRLIVADEPVSALDVSIQAQILNLMRDLQVKFNIAYLFISHDLRIVLSFCQRVAVMYLGRIVEMGAVEAILQEARHPYTKLLLSAVPEPNPRKKTKARLEGEVPSPINPPEGCPFNPRCPVADEGCRKDRPHLEEIEPGHWVACFKI